MQACVWQQIIMPSCPTQGCSKVHIPSRGCGSVQLYEVLQCMAPNRRRRMHSLVAVRYILFHLAWLLRTNGRISGQWDYVLPCLSTQTPQLRVGLKRSSSTKTQISCRSGERNWSHLLESTPCGVFRKSHAAHRVRSAILCMELVVVEMIAVKSSSIIPGNRNMADVRVERLGTMRIKLSSPGSCHCWWVVSGYTRPQSGGFFISIKALAASVAS